MDGAESFVTMLTQAVIGQITGWKDRLKGKTFDEAYKMLKAMIDEKRV